MKYVVKTYIVEGTKSELHASSFHDQINLSPREQVINGDWSFSELKLGRE